MKLNRPGTDEMVEPSRSEWPASESRRLSGTAVIANPQGLHMRPAMAFTKAAQSFASNVTVRHGDQAVNGKSLIEVMLLAAEPGTELTVEVAGDDAPQALPALLEILGSAAAEDVEAEPVDPAAEA